MSKKSVLSYIFFIFLYSVSIVAQTEKEKLPLSSVLPIIEQRYHCKFSYADRYIKDISASVPPEGLSFQEMLTYLAQETPFSYRVINSRLIAIQKKNTTTPSFPTQVEELEEVVLSNYIAKGISKERDGILEVNYKNFGILPGLIEPDVLQTLEALPGVESVNETISTLNIRGGTSDQNLVLWDGIRMYQTGHFFGLISAFNPYQTKEATLIKNGTNPAYGNSVSGVIAMETEKEVNQEFYGEAGVNYISGHGLADIAIDKKASIQVAARTSISSVFKTPTYVEYYDRAFQDTEITSDDTNIVKADDDFSFYDISLRYLYNISKKDKLRVNFIYIGNNLDFKKNIFVGDTLKSKKSTLSQNSIGIGGNYQRKWSKVFRSDLQFYLSNYQLSSKDVNILENKHLFQENKVEESSFKLNTYWNLADRFSLQNGIEYTETTITNHEENTEESTPTINNNSLKSLAYFTNLSFRSYHKRTVANLGARVNYMNELDFFSIEPRFTFNQQFFKYFTVELLGELKSQATTQITDVDFQTDFLGIEKRRWQLANQEDIPILKSKQVSLGINYHKNKWLINIEAYLKKVNGVTSQSQDFQNQYQYTKIIGNYTIKGVDFLINKRFHHFSTWLSYSITDNTYHFPNLPIENFPNNVEIAHSLSCAASYSINKSKVSLGLNWRNGKPFTPITKEGIDTNQTIYETANIDNLHDYMRVDFSASQEFTLGKKMNAYAGISLWNIFDNKNIINAYYDKNSSGKLVKVQQRALGLTPNFVFRIKF